ncbi:hypothetical protein SAMN02787079_01288 [Lysinibacillus sp. TC-37]|nr:hypothetical protein SAMN02787078_01286 [Lysinibacillus sp. SG9]SDB17650.1 hypothetical protein SAMN02787079_01288 [Lysinibacillus sp. TC-37]SFS65182.1 hypothetical protein SAMN02787087_01293 [Lysinibacillus sp. SG55]
MLNQLFIVGVYILIILMLSYITHEYLENKISKQHFLIWLICVFLTGPIAFTIYVIWDKKKSITNTNVK